MKTYLVEIPITGYVAVEVEANSEKEAIDKAFLEEIDVDSIEEWDMHKQIVQGNVFYGLRNRVEVTETGDDEDEE